MENRTERVLIIDDMPINRIVLSSLLATHGVMSDQAESGSECLDLCEKGDYDLILLDHRMPELDGVDTLIRLKELFKSRGRDIPVICHTTEEGRKNINLYKAAGFTDVLIKPVEPRELFEVLMKYLPKKKRSGAEDEKNGEIVSPEAGDMPETPEAPEADPEEVKAELEKLPSWVKLVPHIDLVAGVSNCGSADDYMDALYIFYSSIEEKSEEIERFLRNEDWTMYALRVHSLKSMARLVGAEKIGETAAALEKAVGEEAYRIVRNDTPPFLKAYRGFGELLLPLKEEEEDKPPLWEEASPEEEILLPEGPDQSRSILLIQSGQGIVKKVWKTTLPQPVLRSFPFPMNLTG